MGNVIEKLIFSVVVFLLLEISKEEKFQCIIIIFTNSTQKIENAIQFSMHFQKFQNQICCSITSQECFVLSLIQAVNENSTNRFDQFFIANVHLDEVDKNSNLRFRESFTHESASLIHAVGFQESEQFYFHFAAAAPGKNGEDKRFGEFGFVLPVRRGGEERGEVRDEPIDKDSEMVGVFAVVLFWIRRIVAFLFGCR